MPVASFRQGILPMPTVQPWIWPSTGGRKTHFHASLHGSMLWLQMGIRPCSCSHPQVPLLETGVARFWEQLLQRPVRAVTLSFSEPLTPNGTRFGSFCYHEFKSHCDTRVSMVSPLEAVNPELIKFSSLAHPWLSAHLILGKRKTKTR